MNAPWETLRPGREGCPSELALDRLHAGELPAARASALRRHAGACGICTARMAEREAGFSAFAGVDERALLAGIRRGLDVAPRRRRWWRALLPVAAAAALGAMALAVTRPPAPGVRTKGGLSLHVYRARGGKAEVMLSGDTFAPGDRLEFTVDLPRASYVRVLGVEQSGALYSAWPLHDGTRLYRDAGENIRLDGAVALDGSLGHESLFLIACPSASGPPRCQGPSRPEGAPRCQPGCSMTRFVLEKHR